MEDYARSINSNDIEVIFTQQGEIPTSLLAGPTAISAESHHHHNVSATVSSLENDPIPECGFIKAVNKGEGFQSVGWRFEPNKCFNRAKIYSFLNGIDAERLKAVFITQEGIFGYNLTSDALTEIELDDCMESRIEIIAHEISERWEEELLSAIEDSDND